MTRPQLVASVPSRFGTDMTLWSPGDQGLKRYPHFDARMSVDEATALANDSSRVSQHPFFPFILYEQKWNRFAKAGKKGKSKERPIRYAARADAYIYARYRHELSSHYEDLLKAHNLSNSVLAYRKISATPEHGGKCNIHFAKDAFLKVRELGNCYALALDISGFFESLDHEKLKSIWCRLLGNNRLPDDHYQVFKNITEYAVVEKNALYERLGHFGPKGKNAYGKIVRGYLTPLKKMPIQLCTGKEFREAIAGRNGQPTIIRKNFKPYGIPQGSPISDLLANAYLFDFDCTVSKWCESVGGYYFRYSDDILIICPGGETEAFEMMERVRTLIGTHGKKLKIKKEKSSVFSFTSEANGDQRVKLLHGDQGRNGLEYLGFRYDGKNVYLRDSTLSNLQRKIVRAARYAANSMARRFSNKSFLELQNEFDYEALIQRFGKVRYFGEQQDEYRNWTFWTYAKKSAEIFGPLGKTILSQMKNHRKNVRNRADAELKRAICFRDKRKKAKPILFAPKAALSATK